MNDPDKLRLLAGWLDIEDRTALAKLEEIDGEIQHDLRRIADDIEYAKKNTWLEVVGFAVEKVNECDRKIYGPGESC